MMFKCDKCGKCCRNLDKSPLYAELHSGDGVCKHLDGNLCSIYNERPMICRIDEAYTEFFKDIMTLEEYYEKNYEACKTIKKL